MSHKSDQVRHYFFERRYVFLFFALLLPYILHPLVEEDSIGIIALDLAFSLVLMGSMFAVSECRRVAIPAVSAMILAMGLTWACGVVPGMTIRIAALGLTCGCMLYTGIYLLRNLIKRREVTNNSIFGSLCIYLLIGYVWSFAYSILAMLHPGSFNIDNELFTHQFDGKHVFAQMYYFMYYSFTSLTTLGLGDIMPTTPWARVLTVLEAVIGQIYLVVMVSRLISLHANQRTSS